MMNRYIIQIFSSNRIINSIPDTSLHLHRHRVRDRFERSTPLLFGGLARLADRAGAAVGGGTRTVREELSASPTADSAMRTGCRQQWNRTEVSHLAACTLDSMAFGTEPDVCAVGIGVARGVSQQEIAATRVDDASGWIAERACDIGCAVNGVPVDDETWRQLEAAAVPVGINAADSRRPAGVI